MPTKNGTVKDFDIERYASAPWYVHEQTPTLHLPVEKNHCVRAQYKIRSKPTMPWGYTIDVFNTAQDEFGTVFGGRLCAYQTLETKSKLAVAPCFLPKTFAGPYWVVAYNEEEGYALVPGGQPSIPVPPIIDDSGENLRCRVGKSINNAELLIFSRSDARDQKIIDRVRDIAKKVGFDVSGLNTVDQKNCSYPVLR